MRITAKLFATFTRFGPESQELTVPEGTTVADVIRIVTIPPEFRHLRIVNGVHVDDQHTLKDGDVLALFPPMAGG